MKLGSHTHSIVYQYGEKKVTKCSRCRRLPFALWRSETIVQWFASYDAAMRTA